MKQKKLFSIGSLLLTSSLLFGGMAAASGFYGWPTLTQGSSGGYVRGLQANLYSFGQQSNVGSIDGNFGSGTRTGLINMQNSTGLTADGIAGSGTWNTMNNYSIFETEYNWVVHTPYSTTYQTSYFDSGSSLQYRIMYKNTSTTVQSGYIY
ncbi:peptidoglycan-binding domain-containing protein [Paenibacillus graminis]|uniref:peptidoglycan-binding domain-containing protein n=1 Tax=Paenibacillus graminis TaxID=189425 RepID=UPI00046FAB1F|nr:peptidoglycan-binding domain-containing protein [Paenibacillus graminis]